MEQEFITRLFGNEGGYVVDNGGPTKWGISQHAFPHFTEEQIKNLTQEQAAAIYEAYYYNPLRLSEFHELLRFDLFDAAVNSGLHGAVTILQKALGVNADGIIGQVTIQAASQVNPDVLLGLFNAQRLKHFTICEGWDKYGKGWVNRIADNVIRDYQKKQ